MRKISALILILFLVMMPVNIHADDISSINVFVSLNDDGSADIYQVWDVDNTDGTELYIPIQELNHMEVTHFGVSYLDENEEPIREFEFVDDWDINGSFDDKAYKCGVNYTSDGIELCWGKSEMGRHKYGIYFKYKNLVQAFSDYDGFNVRFINDNMNPAPSQVDVYIAKGGVPFNDENSRIWSFGNTGSINFEDGIVHATDSSFNSNKHVTITMRFNKGIFTPSYEGDGTFEDLRERAFENSSYSNDDYYNDGKKSFSIRGIIRAIIGFITRFFWPLLMLFGVVNVAKNNSGVNIKNKKEADRKNPPYYRDILLDCFLPAIYVMEIQDNKAKKIEENIISAYFLKWIKEGALTTEVTDPEIRAKMLDKKGLSFLQIVGDIDAKSDNEEFFWNHIVMAAGENKVLEERELQKYFRKNYSSMSKLYKNFEEEGINYLIEKGLLVQEGGFAGKKFNFTAEGLKAYSNHLAMHRFFKDFTLISEKSPREVALWDYYLIIATLFGMGDEVSKAFKDLIPEYQYANNMSPMDSYYLSRYMSHAYYRGFGGGRSAASSSSSGGFGGGASFGGGGGFSGGGSGGGSR